MTAVESTEKHENSRSGRRWFVLAGLFCALYATNVALRMLFIKNDIAIWRLDDVGEFLLVLIAMIFFVTGLLSIEEMQEMPESSAAPPHHDLKGGDS